MAYFHVQHLLGFVFLHPTHPTQALIYMRHWASNNSERLCVCVCVCVHQLENSFHTAVKKKKKNSSHLRKFSPPNSLIDGLIYIIDTLMLYIGKFLSFIQYHLRILMLHVLNDYNQRTYKQYGDFPRSSAGKESTCNAGDPSSIPGSERSSGEGIGYPLQYSWASLVAQLVKNLPAMPETWVQSPGWENPLEKGMATYSNILA